MPESIAHPLRYLFIDFNSYFAAVEQHDDPALRGRPVVVVPSNAEYSGAIAVSYEARALGIARGTPVREARALCPQVAIRVARHERYVAMHQTLMDEIGRLIPVTRVYSIDECACRLDRTEQTPERARALALEMKRRIASHVGPCLRSSIGIAPSRLLAKLAAELEKPDGLVVLESHHLPHRLADLPLRAVPGIGAAVEARLARAGIARFMDLWGLEPRHARALWGSVTGERLVRALHGADMIDEAPREKRSISHSRVLTGASRQPEGARIVARSLLLKAASRLRRHGLYASRLRLHVRLCRGERLERETGFIPTRNSWGLLAALDALWAPLCALLAGAPPAARAIAQVGVDLLDLRDRPPDRDLFVPAADYRHDEREARLWATIDRLNRRYGRETVQLASQRPVDLNDLGVKIAFSRVPDQTEFLG